MTNENHVPPTTFVFQRISIFFCYHLRMKSLHYFFSFPLLCFVVACSGPEDSTTESPKVFDSLDNLVNDPEANISHEDGWAIVSKTENGDHVYWFLAPDTNNVSPAQFKKSIHVSDNNEKETKIVSHCDAPKQTCDDFMEKFKNLSEKYK